MGRNYRKKSSSKKTVYRGANPVQPKKYLGQHFLKDENIAAKIADTLSYKDYEYLLEIGPGTGVLTKYLLKKPVHLVALEVDLESVRYLKTDFSKDQVKKESEQKNFEIHQGDFLKYDMHTLFGGSSFAVIGNFPYNISSQILFKVIELRKYVPEFAGMFQKEVAERICAKEGSKIYGILSILTQAFYNAEYLFTVPPTVFSPPPKVDSAVIRLKRKSSDGLPCNEALFFRVVKTAFNQRRKTMRNSLKAFNLSNNLKEDAIFDRRPEELAVADFIALTQRIEHDTV